jgi:hypothetical protein
VNAPGRREAAGHYVIGLLNFGRRDLEKGTEPVTGLLFVTCVDSRFDRLASVRRLKGATYKRRMISSL